MTDHYTYESARHTIEQAITQFDYDQGRAQLLRSRHEIAMGGSLEKGILYVDEQGNPIVDPGTGQQATTPNGYLRAVRPDTWSASPEQALPKRSAGPVSITEAMIASRQGDDTLLAEFKRQQSPISSAAPRSAKINFTEMMLKARSGDATALKTLESHNFA